MITNKTHNKQHPKTIPKNICNFTQTHQHTNNNLISQNKTQYPHILKIKNIKNNEPPKNEIHHHTYLITTKQTIKLTKIVTIKILLHTIQNTQKIKINYDILAQKTPQNKPHYKYNSNHDHALTRIPSTQTHNQKKILIIKINITHLPLKKQ